MQPQYVPQPWMEREFQLMAPAHSWSKSPSTPVIQRSRLEGTLLLSALLQVAYHIFQNNVTLYQAMGGCQEATVNKNTVAAAGRKKMKETCIFHHHIKGTQLVVTTAGRPYPSQGWGFLVLTPSVPTAISSGGKTAPPQIGALPPTLGDYFSLENDGSIQIRTVEGS